MATSTATTVDDYLAELPEGRTAFFTRLLDTVRSSIDPAFAEHMSYGMVGWSVPHSRYPGGYHCAPELPVPFLSIGNQKNFIGYYHLGMYADPDLLDWFVAAHKETGLSLEMGKSCIRLKHPDRVPWALLAELTARVSCEEFITSYEQQDPRTR